MFKMLNGSEPVLVLGEPDDDGFVQVARFATVVAVPVADVREPGEDGAPTVAGSASEAGGAGWSGRPWGDASATELDALRSDLDALRGDVDALWDAVRATSAGTPSGGVGLTGTSGIVDTSGTTSNTSDTTAPDAFAGAASADAGPTHEPSPPVATTAPNAAPEPVPPGTDAPAVPPEAAARADTDTATG